MIIFVWNIKSFRVMHKKRGGGHEPLRIRRPPPSWAPYWGFNSILLMVKLVRESLEMDYTSTLVSLGR